MYINVRPNKAMSNARDSIALRLSLRDSTGYQILRVEIMEMETPKIEVDKNGLNKALGPLPGEIWENKNFRKSTKIMSLPQEFFQGI